MCGTLVAVVAEWRLRDSCRQGDAAARPALTDTAWQLAVPAAVALLASAVE